MKLNNEHKFWIFWMIALPLNIYAGDRMEQFNNEWWVVFPLTMIAYVAYSWAWLESDTSPKYHPTVDPKKADRALNLGTLGMFGGLMVILGAMYVSTFDELLAVIMLVISGEKRLCFECEMKRKKDAKVA